MATRAGLAADYEQRFGSVERAQDQLDLRLQHVERTTDRTAKNVEILIERQASRAEPVSWKQVAAGVLLFAATTVAIWNTVTWSVENAPATRTLAERIGSLEQSRAVDGENNARTAGNRHTAQDDLIACLRAEILNRDIGWRCPNPERVVPYNDVKMWRPTVKPGS